LLDQIKRLPGWENYLELFKRKDRKTDINSSGLIRAARYPVAAAVYRELNRPVLYITDKPSHATLAFDEFGFWLGEGSLMLFPAPDPLFYEQGNWDPATRSSRLKTLITLAERAIPSASAPSNIPFIVTSVRGLMTRTMEKRNFVKSIRTLRTNQQITQEELVRLWVQIGYEPVETVVEVGKFARRGGLLDIWPPDSAFPVRIDFFGDEIDTIRTFDPATQRNLSSLERIQIGPAREFLFSEIPENPYFSSRPDEFLIPLLHPQPSCLMDYLPENTLILADDWIRIQTLAEDIEEQAEKLRNQSIVENILPADFPTPYVSFSEIRDLLDSFQWHNLSRGEEGSNLPIGEKFIPEERFGGKVNGFIDFLLEKTFNNEKVFVVSRQQQRLKSLWDNLGAEAEISEKPIILSGTISEGFKFTNREGQVVHFLTDSEIFGWERPIPRKVQQKMVDVPEQYFADLKPGDYVVHIDYGIGRYSGLVSRSIDGVAKEFLCIEYAQGDQLFVPVHQADRLTNYIGPDGRVPELTRLGTQEWLSVKQHVSEKVVEVAEDLLDLYAKRQVTPGYAFSPDTTWQMDMEGSFPYIETEDQRRAIRQVKEDMERPRPMDRLICGDVGFGKTEVALRAAFKAACDGKQVAVMVPTTVLAQQHYDTFKQRFASYPVNVEMLSRFRTQKEQDQILRKLAEGEIDVVIGTHRLVSSDVKFKDLGLIIIDEEQRFGVAQKEYLKKMRTEVDVLTMTATPIPRTLYMALTGARDISSINTPPDERVPIVTHVGPYSDKLVRQAIMREMDRDGQVFYVHNRVQSIYAIAKHLQELVPEARIGIGHGQLPEKELSEVMESFYNREIDVLLSTSIIESGLDVPNANTLIVDRADTLGLAQLYQIRGRVGRSSQRAYAYFFQQRGSHPTEEGLERLEVIAENTQLGAGFSIAMRDLEMRGAGEILGNKQHGSIAAVGFNLYTRLLAQAVKKVKEDKGLSISDEEIGITKDMAVLFNPITVELPMDIGIPEGYIPEQKTRIKLYRRIASIHEEEKLIGLKDEFQERFGPMPEIVRNLFFQILIKIKAEKIGLSAVVKEGNSIVLRFSSFATEMERGPLPEVGGGIRPGKNAYWLTLMNFQSDEWRNDLLVAMELVEDRLAQQKIRSKDFREPVEKSGVTSFLDVEKSP